MSHNIKAWNSVPDDFIRPLPLPYHVSKLLLIYAHTNAYIFKITWKKIQIWYIMSQLLASQSDAHRIAPHRDPIQHNPRPRPIHPSTYSSKARKTHDVIYFWKGNCTRTSKIKPSKMEVAPQGCLQITNKKATNKINWVRFSYKG